ncbi:nitrilase-related carbon-nitrogen hydrolase [Streptomyces sp. NPDC015125]|uniref:nitrilase-related carbon-nitrogen hydrolase n=1 Tax=Streptomyces sp. NPDC015125 TaxID=3364938 RepID=UPI0036F88932
MIIAAAQFLPVPGDIEANAARMAALLTEAAARGAGLVVFSELALTHYDLDLIAADPSGMTVTEDDDRLAPIREACRATGVAAVVNAAAVNAAAVSAAAVSATGRAATDGVRPTISSFVLGPDGALITRYDKVQLFGGEGEGEGERALFAPGTADGRFTLGGIRFALATCYDNSFPEVPARAAADGCRVYLASSFHDAAQRVAQYGQLAREHGLQVLLANGTGTGRSGSGCGLSGAWLPSGERVAAAAEWSVTVPGDGAELVLSDVRDRITLMGDPAVAAIPVQDCGEPLLDVRTAAPGLLVAANCQDAQGAFAWLRAGVLQRLLTAQEALPDGLRLQIVEGYRPPALQRRYFEGYADELRASYPDWEAGRIHRAASRYVSPPEIAPHSAGGAVDLTLVTAEGEEVDMGTPIDASPEESNGACYTGAPDLTPAARAHRRVLNSALHAAGLVNYPTEWWHWSYGDRYWALATGADHALYGPREPAER